MDHARTTIDRKNHIGVRPHPAFNSISGFAWTEDAIQPGTTLSHLPGRNSDESLPVAGASERQGATVGSATRTAKWHRLKFEFYEF